MMHKSKMKQTLAVILGVVFLVVLGLAIASVNSSYSNIKEYDTSYRLSRAESHLARGDMGHTKNFLVLYDCYEPEFDYLWEQIDMHDLYSRYLIYVKAAEVETDLEMKGRFAEKALQMKNDLMKLCEGSTFDENKAMAEHYSRLVRE